jgi:hypothetical protein
MEEEIVNGAAAMVIAKIEREMVVIRKNMMMV